MNKIGVIFAIISIMAVVILIDFGICFAIALTLGAILELFGVTALSGHVLLLAVLIFLINILFFPEKRTS